VRRSRGLPPQLNHREPRRSTHGEFGCFVDEAVDIGYGAELGAWGRGVVYPGEIEGKETVGKAQAGGGCKGRNENVRDLGGE